MEVIKSGKNAFIKSVKGLHLRKNREYLNEFIIEGLRFVEEAILANADIKCVILAKSFYDKLISASDDGSNKVSSSVLEKYIKSHVTVDRSSGGIVIVEDFIFDGLCDTANPQGVLAVVRKRFKGFDDVEEILSSGSFIVVLDSLQDPGNLGTIIRTSHAAGADLVILSKGCVDIYNPKTLRATMGSIFHVPVVAGGEAVDIVKLLKERGFYTLASHLRGKDCLYDIDFKDRVAAVIGNEGKGIDDEVADACDKLVLIPMPGGAESLNASVAAGILIYEVVRRGTRGQVPCPN